MTAIAFDHDGDRLATGGVDGLVKIWRARTGQPLLTLTGHTADVTEVAFSPDGTTLVSTSFDGTARAWILDIGDLLRAARERLTRSLTLEECIRFLHQRDCPP